MKHLYYTMCLCSIILIFISYLNSDSIKYFILKQPQEIKKVLLKQNLVFDYKFLLKCKTNYTTTTQSNVDYTTKADISTHSLRIVRGIMVYYPIEQHIHYESEFKWFYQSWIEMLQYEPSLWRTDLLIFINSNMTNRLGHFFESYNCSFKHQRLSNINKPMCRLIAYQPLNSRIFDGDLKIVKYDYIKEFIKNVNIFDDNDEKIKKFKYNLKTSLFNYNYLDSILIAFESYVQFKDTYNFLIRSDIDVFFTPLFAQWLPKQCHDFYVGRGGYSDSFNMKRLSRIAKNLNFKYANSINLGSTWYSTPTQFRLVSYLTLFSMFYISNEEFSPPEKNNEVFLWPYWHYGVLLLYGQDLALNHLIATKQINIINLSNMIDVPTDSQISIFKSLHLHVFHGDDLFSKFKFKQGFYDNLKIPDIKEHDAKSYALRLALESKNLSIEIKHKIFEKNVSNKI